MIKEANVSGIETDRHNTLFSPSRLSVLRKHHIEKSVDKARWGKTSVGPLCCRALALDDWQGQRAYSRQLQSIMCSMATRSHYRSHTLYLTAAFPTGLEEPPGLHLIQVNSFCFSYSESSARHVCSLMAKGSSSLDFTHIAKVGGKEELIYVPICHSALLHVYESSMTSVLDAEATGFHFFDSTYNCVKSDP